MEYAHFLPHLADYLPDYLSSNEDFKSWLKMQNDAGSMVDQMADFLVMTLPHPRINFYESSDYKEIQKGVTDHVSGL